ncbi:MAG: hypothetical protein EOP28_06105, partial [Rhodococcus sp. (in: high G+C Gram-positive bacteria)]
MRAITRGIVTAGTMIGAVLAGAGTGVAEPAAAPNGTYQGTTTVPAGELIWKGKTFQEGTVVNNFTFGLTGLAG